MDSSDRLKVLPEIIRKSIHLCCSLLPLLYYFYLSREQIIIISSIISITLIISEYLRYHYNTTRNLFHRVFDSLLRESEKDKTITGATYLFISATVTFIIFKKNIAIPAVLVLTISDSFAAIVGKATVSPKFIGKSVAGSLTFFIITGIILIILFPGKAALMVMVAALLTILEALPLKINDNIVIPIATGILLYLVI